MKSTKLYDFTRSPLYGLSNKSELARLLGTDRKTLVKIAKNKNNYNVFYITKNSKKRQVQEPKKYLKKLSSKLQILISRISTPDYLHSGVKNRYYVSNAATHLNNKYVVTTDIRSFYPSCDKEYVFRLFKNTFKVSEDVAWLITDLFTYNGKIPTGSPVSQIIAYWAFKVTFDKIHDFSQKNGVEFSLYVDDMTFSSSKPISKSFISLIQKDLKKVSLSLHKGKTVFYHPEAAKRITGCDVKDNQLFVPKEKVTEIIKMYNAIYDSENVDSKALESLIGKISAAQQIDNLFFRTKLENLKRLQRKVNKVTVKYPFAEIQKASKLSS